MNIRNLFKQVDDTIKIPEGGYASARPSTRPCAQCGSIFLAESLTVEPTISIALGKGGKLTPTMPITTNFAHVCEVCKGPSDISLSLRTDGVEQDERHFDVSNGFFQEIDAVTKEEVFTVDPTQYAELTCEYCGGFVERGQIKRCNLCKKGS